MDHRTPTGGLAENGDLVGVSAEQVDVFLHPVERRSLIQKTRIGCRVISGLICSGEKAEATQLR